MTIFEFIRNLGCKCGADGPVITLRDGTKVGIAPRLDVASCETSDIRGMTRPRLKRFRRRWARYQRRMKRRGEVYRSDYVCRVTCHGCGISGVTHDHLEGAL
jgi:hypothetical protein